MTAEEIEFILRAMNAQRIAHRGDPKYAQKSYAIEAKVSRL